MEQTLQWEGEQMKYYDSQSDAAAAAAVMYREIIVAIMAGDNAAAAVIRDRMYRLYKEAAAAGWIQAAAVIMGYLK